MDFYRFAKNIDKNIGKHINKNLSGKYIDKLLDYAKQSTADALKTFQEKHLKKNSRNSWL